MTRVVCASYCTYVLTLLLLQVHIVHTYGKLNKIVNVLCPYVLVFTPITKK